MQMSAVGGKVPASQRSCRKKVEEDLLAELQGCERRTNTEKPASLDFGRRATPAQTTQVVQKLRQRHSRKILLSIAQLSRATFATTEREWNVWTNMPLLKRRSQPYTMKTEGDIATAALQQSCVTAIFF